MRIFISNESATTIKILIKKLQKLIKLRRSIKLISENGKLIKSGRRISVGMQVFTPNESAVTIKDLIKQL